MKGLLSKPLRLLARVAGFEPANDGIRIRCLTAWLYPISNDILAHPDIYEKNNLGWMVGFEPTNTGATTQGLNHLTTPTTYPEKVATGNGLEPSTSSVTGWHSNQLNYPAPLLVIFAGCFVAALRLDARLQ